MYEGNKDQLQKVRSPSGGGPRGIDFGNNDEPIRFNETFLSDILSAYRSRLSSAMYVFRFRLIIQMSIFMTIFEKKININV